MKKFLIYSLVIIAFIASRYEIGINTTPSLERGIYYISNENIKRNDIIKFCLEDEEFSNIAHKNGYLDESYLCENGLQPLLKQVAGLAGDKVEVSAKGIFVTPKGKDIACTWYPPQTSDTKGRPLFSKLESGEIPKGKVLALTTYKNGFDSRYFGLIDIKSTSKANNLLTF